MGRIATRNQPCESCGSSDAKQIYEDGSAFCFSCRKNFFAPKEGYMQEPVENKRDWSNKLREVQNDYPTKGFKERNIFRQVSEHYGVKVSYDLDGNIYSHYYPYYNDDTLVGYKVRKLPKEFTSIGSVKGGLFGLNLYNGGKRIVITEGELDAMA